MRMKLMTWQQGTALVCATPGTDQLTVETRRPWGVPVGTPGAHVRFLSLLCAGCARSGADSEA